MRHSHRAVATAIVIMLAGGSLYSTAATVRFYQGVFVRSAVGGSDATIADNLRPVNLANGQQLRDAAERAGWPAGADIVVLAPVSKVSEEELAQLYYSVSYLLYPRPVWASMWCDHEALKEACSRRHALSDPVDAVDVYRARRVVLMGPLNPFARGSSTRLSSRISLVDLE